MTAPDPADLGVDGVVTAIQDRRLSAIEVVEACLGRIAATDGRLLAWVDVDADGARAQARARDADIVAGRPVGSLGGVPVGIKDIFDVAGLPARAGAPSFAHRTPSADAPAVARLRAAGAVIVGKTHTTQFAFSDPAPTLNPWSAAHTPGGSSSGSAAAVAARQVPAAIGTQTGGSILRPAAYCGVVGLKGPFGAVPLEGVVPLAPSMDHGGSFARSLTDAATIWGVLADRPMRPAGFRAVPRLAVAPELLARADPTLRAHLDDVVARLRTAGAIVREVELGFALDSVVAAGRLVMAAEAARVHAASFERHADAYGPGIAGLIRAGQAVTPEALAEAARVRLACRATAGSLLDDIDALLSPVAFGSAPPLVGGTGDFSLCLPWSFIGVPSLSIPTGLDAAGLPFALQLSGGSDRDAIDRLLTAATWCERVIGFNARPAIESR